MKTVVIFAHSDVKNASIANRLIIDRLNTVDGVEIRDLYQLYPDFKIDIEAEQHAMSDADVILFQYPFHWYSIPGLLKEWMDRVFLRGFAYGPGRKLEGKDFLISTTIGGPKDSYQEGGHNLFTVQDFLKPMVQTANFTGMKYNEPVVSHGMVFIPNGDNSREDIEQRAIDHADRLIQRLDDFAKKYESQNIPEATELA
ncbi:NAD(P)H-dependent oxidoreductase [Litoribrevibacter albus]|uniref:Glutathione-regulated potassium-efflux system ancillary protein KefF n=1 Tax=Litoribrevibacter albus TaxID=1473156 RepID=A0AA37S7G5_9GAMM|nr:NAD(P)H-dependent oxidoreductase [Litoribrevibacter albus]GLQ29597.1 glutathione-regulated potassium-efflux system ancillary protein KefF [Litoribrevibacter albus]